MTQEDKCLNCSALVYPYIFTVDRHGRKLPKERWHKTCRKSIAKSTDDMRLRGLYGECYPEGCEGPNGRNYRIELDIKTCSILIEFI